MALTETNIVNAFETTLAAQLASGGTTMNLTDDPGVAAPAYFVIAPDSDSAREVIKWDSGAYNNASVTRDLDSKHGTDPTHASGTTVRLAVVKQHIEDTHDRINDIALTGDVTGTLASATQDIATTIAAGAVDFAMIADTIDEDNMASDSATKLPTQQSVKAYADTKATTSNRLDEFANPTSGLDINDQEVSKAILKDYSETDVAVTSSSGVVSIDLANGNTGTITLTENITDIDFTNVPTNGVSTFTLQITQDSTDRTVAINAVTVNGGGNVTAKTAGGAGFTMSTGSGAIDLVTFLFVDAGTPLLNALQNFS